MYTKSILNSFRLKKQPKLLKKAPIVLKETNNGYLASRRSNNHQIKKTNLSMYYTHKQFISSIYDSKNDIERINRFSTSILQTENESITDDNLCMTEPNNTIVSLLNSPVSSTPSSKKEIDYSLIEKATFKLKNIIERKRRNSFDKYRLQIATNKLQRIIDKSSKRNMTMSKTKRKKRSLNSSMSSSQSHQIKHSDISSNSKLCTIFKEKDKLDKILKLESILSSHHTDSNSTVTYSESKRSQSPIIKEPITYSLSYMLSLKDKPICLMDTKMNSKILSHIENFSMVDIVSTKDVQWNRTDVSKEIAIAEHFVNDIHKKNNSNKVKSDILAMLNTLTVDNYENVKESIYTYIKDNEDFQSIFVNVVINKAISEKFYVGLYAKMCSDIDKKRTDKTQKSYFRLHLIEECKKIFLTNMEEGIDVNDEEAEMKYKKRMIGNVKYISELIKVRMLSQKIGFFCIDNLLMRINNDYVSDKEKFIILEALIELLDAFGKVVFERGKKEYIDIIDEFIEKELIKYSQIEVPGFIKYKIINLIDKKNNQWKDSLFQQSTVAKGKKEASSINVIKVEDPVKEVPKEEDSNVTIVKKDLLKWIDYKGEDYEYNWTTIESLYKTVGNLGIIVTFFVDASIDIVNTSAKLVKANSYISIIIEFYLQFMMRNELDTMASMMIKLLLTIDDIIGDNKYMIDILGNLLYILLNSRIIIMKKLNLFEKKDKNTIKNLALIVKSAIEHSGAKKKRMYNDFSQVKLFKDNASIFKQNVPSEI